MVGDTSAADKTRFSVHDQQLAMRPVVYFRPGIPPHRVIPAHLATSSAQAIKIRGTSPKAAQRIDDDAHFDSGFSAFRQCGQNFVANSPLCEFVEFQVDGIFCPADGLEICGEEFNSVFQPRNPRMAPGSVRHQAEELNELLGVERGGGRDHLEGRPRREPGLGGEDDEPQQG